MLAVKMSRVPIIVILGATGTGKSKLAVQIAKKFNGEVISADSMQVYEGLSITSNKITKFEREGVPHYLLDICKPTDRFSVLDFRNRTLPIIDDIVKRQKLPVIVGGTTYYIDSVLYNTLMEAPLDNPNDLVFQRRRVVNKTEKLDKWTSHSKRRFSNTKKKSDTTNIEHSVQKEEDIASSIYESDSSRLSKLVTPTADFSDSMNLFCDDIVQIRNLFEKSLIDIITPLELHYDHYRRTFYRMPGSGNQNEAISDISDVGKIEKLSIQSVVQVETSLLYDFLHDLLKQNVSYTGKILHQKGNERNAKLENFNSCRDPYLIWNEKNVYDRLIRVGKQSQARDSDLNHYITDPLQELEKLCQNNSCEGNITVINSCKMLNEVIDIIRKVKDIRLKRLKLIRIIDDENLIDFSNEDLYSELKLLDCKTANTLHPNDRRKVTRAIQLFMSTGKTVIQLRKEQHMTYNCTVTDDYELNEHSLSLRYPNSLILWLRCDQDVLNNRLMKRVDEMIKNGLIEELEAFHKQYNLDRLKNEEFENVDYSKGIFQSIGLKEFHSYLMLSAEEKESQSGQKEFQTALKRLKNANIQYSKTQNRYVTNKFVKIPDVKQIPPLFELDCTDMEKWHENVAVKALTLIDFHLKKEVNDQSYPYAAVVRESADSSRFIRGEFFCDVCQRLFTNQHQLHIHNSSRGHRKSMYNVKLRELRKRMAVINRPSPRECGSDEDTFEDYLWDECTIQKELFNEI